MKWNAILGKLVIVLCLIVLPRCGESPPPPVSPPAVPAAPAPAAVPVTPIVPSTVEFQKAKQKMMDEEYTYNPIGKPDPFKPFISEIKKETRPDVPITPLQKFDIYQLKLIAIVWGIKEPTAMVEDPDGKGYVIRKGTLIGKNNGVIVKISPNEALIEERYLDYLTGDDKVNQIVLHLPEEGGL